MKVASLFSGCGGLDLGLTQAGHEIILQCENDPSAQQVLKHQFPGVMLIPDICGLQSLPLGTELVAAGFPCIDVSRAGLQLGIDGQSTGLVRHVFRLLEAARRDQHPVPYVLLENVESLLHRIHGEAAPVLEVVAALEALGYASWAQRIISSAGFGVPNRRKRVFILAALFTDARDVLLVQGQQPCLGACTDSPPCAAPKASPCVRAGSMNRHQPPAQCYECFLADDHDDYTQHTLALDLGNGRSPPAVDVVPTFTCHNSRMCLMTRYGQLGALRIADAERLQGFPAGYTEAGYPIRTPTADLCGQRQDADATAARDRARFALLGNAVTVQVGRWLGERLANPFQYKYLRSVRDVKLISTGVPASRPLLCTFGPPLASSASTTVSNKKCNGSDEAWPRAAWYVRGLGRHGLGGVSEVPLKAPFVPLSSFISEVGPPPSNALLTVFIHRLRENGFNVDALTRRAVACGATLDPMLTRGVAWPNKRKAPGARDPDAPPQPVPPADALAQAAQQAGAEPRCRQCETCRQSTASAPRRCLMVRARAAAASGHNGAQLAVLGAAAVGRGVQVWWPLDEEWYSGKITEYDHLRVRHTVVYDDGDTEIIALWQSDQLVRAAQEGQAKDAPQLCATAGRATSLPGARARPTAPTAGMPQQGGDVQGVQECVPGKSYGRRSKREKF